MSGTKVAKPKRKRFCKTNICANGWSSDIEQQLEHYNSSRQGERTGCERICRKVKCVVNSHIKQIHNTKFQVCFKLFDPEFHRGVGKKIFHGSGLALSGVIVLT